MTCTACGKPLSVYDVGFYRRIVNRGAQSCMCISCTAAYYRMTQERAWQMIRHFQREGCTLFPPYDETEQTE